MFFDRRCVCTNAVFTTKMMEFVSLSFSFQVNKKIVVNARFRLSNVLHWEKLKKKIKKRKFKRTLKKKIRKFIIFIFCMQKIYLNVKKKFLNN